MQVPELPADDAFRFTAELRTRWVDEDAQAVLNNAVFMTLFEEARLAYFGDLDLMEDGVFPFVLAQTNVCFLRPGRGGRDVRVAVQTSRLGTTSCEQLYRVTDTSSGRVWAEAHARLVGWDPGGRGKRAYSETFRRRVAAFEGLSLPGSPEQG